jgi:hypothetical protein
MRLQRDAAKRRAPEACRWAERHLHTVDTHMNKWGFIRETSIAAQKAGIDKDTGLHRTGLEEYFAVIFPTVKDWVHDRALGEVSGRMIRSRPDYRSEQLKLIVEFDGLQHYTKPDKVQKDADLTTTYQALGYKVARIPYFIQLSNKAVLTLFGVDVPEPLFDERIPSLGIKGFNTPAHCCPRYRRVMYLGS